MIVQNYGEYFTLECNNQSCNKKLLFLKKEEAVEHAQEKGWKKEYIQMDGFDGFYADFCPDCVQGHDYWESLTETERLNDMIQSYEDNEGIYDI